MWLPGDDGAEHVVRDSFDLKPEHSVSTPCRPGAGRGRRAADAQGDRRRRAGEGGPGCAGALPGLVARYRHKERTIVGAARFRTLAVQGQPQLAPQPVMPTPRVAPQPTGCPAFPSAPRPNWPISGRSSPAWCSTRERVERRGALPPPTPKPTRPRRSSGSPDSSVTGQSAIGLQTCR